MNAQTLRNRLRGLLEEGATQAEIAAAAGVPQNCVSRFLASKTDIGFSKAEKLMAVASGTTPIGRSARSNTPEDSEGED